MNRLRLFILLFLAAVAVPLGFLVARTFSGLAGEERAELGYFGDALFDRMEEELAAVVRREEGRSIEDYAATPFRGPDRDEASGTDLPDYIVGYLQNGPDGGLQIPAGLLPASADHSFLGELNEQFNRKRLLLPEPYEPSAALAEEERQATAEKEETTGFADKYLSSEPLAKRKAVLGQERKRVEEISVSQAANIARRQVQEPQPTKDVAPSAAQPAAALEGLAALAEAGSDLAAADADFSSANADPSASPPSEGPPVFAVEVAPLQSVLLDPGHVFLFRRIAIDNQIFRQGLVIDTGRLLRHLAEAHFAGQPLARFTALELIASDSSGTSAAHHAGAPVASERFRLSRTFPRPFSFLRATLSCEKIPPSPARRTLMLTTGLLALTMLAGLFAIYRSALLVSELAERRAGFVSAVSHELKTPLTTIRMYIEMLQQNIAPDEERRQQYFTILSGECGRLTRLINNVLEFSKLSNRQRTFQIDAGTLQEVISEVQGLMAEKIGREGFSLTVDNRADKPFRYDREAMVQILINLIDNSLKFGAESRPKELTLSVATTDRALVRLSDTGPGIAREASRKIFDDFYREDNSLTRRTKGTGIGLALVRKLAEAMGGRVSAANNQGPGCTITVELPLAP